MGVCAAEDGELVTALYSYRLPSSVCPRPTNVFTALPTCSPLLTPGSMGVCAADDGELVTDESCPLVPKGKGPSTDRLLDAEEAVTQVRGVGV